MLGAAKEEGRKWRLGSRGQGGRRKMGDTGVVVAGEGQDVKPSETETETKRDGGRDVKRQR